jgi:hypothetical protein
MRIVYLGAEVPSNRLLLGSANIKAMGISYYRLTARGLPKTKSYLIENYFDEDVHVTVQAGIPKGKDIDRADLEEFAANYEEFIVENIDRINVFTELDHHLLSPDFSRTQRETVWAELPPSKFLPVWVPSSGQRGLAELTAKYLDVAIPGDALDGNTWLPAAI